jgi:transposase
MFTAREPLRLSSGERSELQQVLRSTNLPAGIVRRAGVLLLLADRVSFRQIQAQTGMSPRRALAWKRNWQQKGMDGLLDAPRAGRPKRLTPGKEAAILAATESAPAGAASHWSTRRMARRVGVSHVTVMRVWHKAGLQPHRQIQILRLRPRTFWGCI